MISPSVAVGVTTLVLVHALFKYFTRPSLSMIRGPKSPSFVFGNLLEIFQRQVGEADFAWQSLYGNVVRFKGVFGEDRLLVTDIKALQTIFNASPHNYSKLPSLRAVSRTINGRGIAWAEGEDHKRQRSVMAPGFGVKESRAFLPIFKECAESLSTKWLETIVNSDGHITVLNVRGWLSRGTLDAIGQAAFDVQFGSIRDDLHPLAKVFEKFIGGVFGRPSANQILVQAILKYIPSWILQWIFNHSSNPRIACARDASEQTTALAAELVREKADALLQGMGNRDVFTLLVQANMDADAKNKLAEDELLAQMRTILIAGHETTANSVSWILLELARNPSIQTGLRDEIRKTESNIQVRGNSSLTFADLDSMPYLNAVIKEGLRFHSIVPHAWRMACRDDILPLFKPILTESGEMISEVLVPEGTEILVSIAAYHRDKDLWGEDAHEFNPDRWLNAAMNGKKPTTIGVYSNLLTFLSGPRTCLGWRIAVLEIQAFLFELVGKFEFTKTDKADRILRQPMQVMSPMVDGELDSGIQLPLAVSLAPQGD